jgi:nitrogen fixation NifU-like protein
MTLQELYQATILEHARHSQFFGTALGATHHASGDNPLCGDRIAVSVTVSDGLITQARFNGSGCAISQAAASLLCQSIEQQKTSAALALAKQFIMSLTQETDLPSALPQDLSSLLSVRRFPMRIKCATLSAHALVQALNSKQAQNK